VPENEKGSVIIKPQLPLSGVEFIDADLSEATVKSASVSLFRDLSRRVVTAASDGL
jgi:hypothetical protein